MRKEELWFNLALGLSIITWGAIGCYEGIKTAPSVVRIASSGLNLCIGVLFLVRSPVHRSGSWYAVAITLPSFLLGGVLFKFAQPFQAWPPAPEWLFLGGVVFTVLSFLFLGKNFAISPNLRSITTGGPYRLVRHPGYLGEITMVVACAWAIQHWLGWVGVAAFVLGLYFRIQEEEKLLSASEAYQQYKSTVRWKLIPLVW